MGKYLERYVYNSFADLEPEYILSISFIRHKFLLSIANLDSNIIYTGNLPLFFDFTNTSTIPNNISCIKTSTPQTFLSHINLLYALNNHHITS